MNKLKSIAAVLVIVSGVSSAFAGEMEVIREESGVKFNERMLGTSAADISASGLFSVPQPELSSAVSGSSALPAVQQAQPKAAPAATGDVSPVKAVAVKPSTNKHYEPCYDAYGTYYDCHHNHYDHDNHSHEPVYRKPLTIGSAIGGGLVLGVTAALIWGTPVGLIVGAVVLVVLLGRLAAQSKEKR